METTRSRQHHNGVVKMAQQRQAMLLYFNQWWTNKNAPKELFKARVVPIFKKGRHRFRRKLLTNLFIKQLLQGSHDTHTD